MKNLEPQQKITDRMTHTEYCVVGHGRITRDDMLESIKRKLLHGPEQPSNDNGVPMKRVVVTAGDGWRDSV